MKRKAIYIISMLITMLLVSSLVVYAAFVMTHNYEADINHHVITIDKTQLGMVATDNTTTDNTLSFANPGDKVTITYTLSNPDTRNDTRNYEYYYTLSTTATDQKLLNMIYVYQDDVYCGVLSECLKKGLLEPEYIFAGESTTNTTARTNVLVFELHNGASSYVSGSVTLPITVTCNIETTNYQDVLFADSDAAKFSKIIDDINSVPEKTIVLTNNVTTTEAYTIANNCTIDLCGKALTLGADVTIAPGVEVEIIDSRTSGAVAGAGKFVLNSEDSFIKLETKVSQIQVDNYNKTRLMEELAKQYANDGYIVRSNETYDLLGVYSVYGAIPNSSEVIIETETGVIQASLTALDTNEVIGIVYFEGDSTYETVFEFKYIGSDNDVFASIINDDLKHLAGYLSANTEQTSNHFFLPTAIKEHNATISWHSSNPEILSNDGIVQYDQGSVVLTATIKVYDKVFVQKYYIYIVQQDNLSKLQYLATRIEQGTELTIGEETLSCNVLLDMVGKEYAKPLPTAGNDNDAYYYTNWTDNTSLGIVSLSYEVENAYYYLTVDTTRDTNDAVLAPNVYLNQVTYSKVARIKMNGTFENGEEHSVYVTVTIDLSESELKNEVFDNIQTYLNSVNVLQNILDTREMYGALNEKGDFQLPATLDVIKLDYDSTNTNLYRIEKTYKLDSKGDYIQVTDSNGNISYKPSSNGNYSVDQIWVRFNDLKYLSLTDKQIKLRVKIRVVSTLPSGEVEDTYPAERDLSFIVPGAITPENFVSVKTDQNGVTTTTKIFDMDNVNSKRIFYSFKYQTLQQSDTPYYLVTKDVVSVNLPDKSSEETKSVTEGGITTTTTTTTVVTQNTITEIKNYLNGQVETIVTVEEVTDVTAVVTDTLGNKTVDESSSSVIISSTSTTKKDAFTLIVDEDLTKPNNVYSLGQYILMYDIENTQNLIFEYSQNAIIIDYYDINVFKSILDWAVGSGTSTVEENSSFKEYIDTNLHWIESNGSSELSDGEIKVILSYAERYPGFMDMWNDRVDVLDNTLSQNDINKILKTLINDKYFISILNWIEDSNNTGIPLYQWMYMVDETSPLYNSELKNEVIDEEIINEMLEELNSKTKIPNTLLKIINGDGEEVTDDEERVLVYYVMVNYGISYTRFDNFYSIWKGTITRQNDNSDNFNLITSHTPSNVVTEGKKYYGLSEDNEGYTPSTCLDPIFVKILNWITFHKCEESSEIQKLSVYINEYNVLSEYKNETNIWYYSQEYGILGRSMEYSGDMLNDKEWTVLWTYLSYYNIKTITVGNFKYIYDKPTSENEDISVNNNGTTTEVTTKSYNALISSNIANLSSILTGTAYDGGYQFTESFINEIIKFVNNLYATTFCNDYKLLIDWAKSSNISSVSSVESLSWNKVITNHQDLISGIVDEFRIKDCNVNVSYDEYYVIYNFLLSYLKDIIIDQNLINELMMYYIDIDMGFSNNKINDKYSNIILSLNTETLVIEEVLEQIMKLGNVAPGDVYYDNLETLSKEEIYKLATLYPNKPAYIKAINDAISAYKIPVDANGNAVISSVDDIEVVTGYDRSLADDKDNDTKTDYDDLLGKINTILNNNSSTKTYKYITVGQISNSDVEEFGILIYYESLKELVFRGNSANFLFTTSDNANSVFNIIAKSCNLLERLTMNYTGLSDITQLSNLLNLLHLDLRGNYAKGDYVGLSEISSLILLNDLKTINNKAKLQYLNVFNTDVLFNRIEVVLSTLYQANNDAELWFEYNGIETKYPYVEEILSEEKLAYQILSLLYEMEKMTGDYIVLPNCVYVYAQTTNGMDAVKYDIKWNVVIANSTIKINQNLNRIEKINSSNSSIDVTVNASVTMASGNTYYRYFVITVLS